MAVPKKSRQILEFALIFAALYLVTDVALKTFFPGTFGKAEVKSGIELRAQDPTVKDGHHPVLLLANHTENSVTLKNRCPDPPVDVFYAETGEADLLGSPLKGSGAIAMPCVLLQPVLAGDSLTIELGPWKYTHFGRLGNYAVRLPEGTAGLKSGTGAIVARFQIHEAGAPTKLFRTFITRPFLNFLIFIASVIPGHSLGIAIIVLTLVVKLLLFFPTQHALEGQKKMQKLQPKMEALKKQHAGRPEELQKQMMHMWKEHKVNPFQSCLPLLIQFPVLIGLFYTVRDGSHLALSRHLLYPFYEHLLWTFNTQFLGIDLLRPELLIMPVGLALMQFLQMKLSFSLAKRKKGMEEKKGSEGKEGKEGKQPLAPDVIQQRVMLYALPLMIGFFAFQFPAAVSLYWAISTIFAIGQQLVVNRKVA